MNGREYSDKIELYDPEKDVWEMSEIKLPGPIKDIFCCEMPSPSDEQPEDNCRSMENELRRSRRCCKPPRRFKNYVMA